MKAGILPSPCPFGKGVLQSVLLLAGSFKQAGKPSESSETSLTVALRLLELGSTISVSLLSSGTRARHWLGSGSGFAPSSSNAFFSSRSSGLVRWLAQTLKSSLCFSFLK